MKALLSVNYILVKEKKKITLLGINNVVRITAVILLGINNAVIITPVIIT